MNTINSIKGGGYYHGAGVINTKHAERPVIYTN